MDAITIKFRDWVAKAKIENEPIVTELFETCRNYWLTIGQVTDELMQRRVATDIECLDRKRQYEIAKAIVLKLRRRGLLDCCLGSDDGREVRVYKLF